MNKQAIKVDHVCLIPSQQIGVHQQATWELSYIIKGRGVRTIGSQSEPFETGDMVLVPPEIPHCWKFGDQETHIENISVMFPMDLLHLLADQIEVMRGIMQRYLNLDTAIVLMGNTKQQIISILCCMENESEAMRMVSLLQVLVTIGESLELRSVGKRSKLSEVEKKIEKIKVYITCNFMRELRIDDIAQYMGMNRSALCTFFSKHEQKTIMAYVTERRLAESKHLLVTTTLSVQQVCYKSGFQDVPHFCRIFKQAVGMTPTAYRHSRQNNYHQE